MHPSVLFAQELCAGARGMLADVDVIWDMRLLPRPTQQRFEVQSLSFGLEQVPGRRRNTQTTQANEHPSSLRGTSPLVLSSAIAVLYTSSNKTR